MKSKLALVLLSATMIFLTGCSCRVADMSIITTKNINLNEVNLDKLPQRKNVVGKDSNLWVTFIPFGYPQLEDAVDDALNKGNGDVMIDAVIHSTSWWFLLGQDTISVKGTVVKTRDN